MAETLDFDMVDDLRDEVKKLRQLLERSRRIHLYVDDCWYSCPKAVETCSPEPRGTCNCGADKWNAEVDAALAETAA